jgi:hypothetical protein
MGQSLMDWQDLEMASKAHEIKPEAMEHNRRVLASSGSSSGKLTTSGGSKVGSITKGARVASDRHKGCTVA